MADDGKHDDLADALAKLANGDVAPSEQEPPAPVSSSPAPAKPASPSPPNARGQRPPAAPTSRSTAPAARPHRPTTPAPRPTAPPTFVRPAPTPMPEEADVASEIAPFADAADEEHQEVTLDDDDAVIVPAPDASAFAPRPRRSTGPRGGPQAAIYQTIEFRRTIIPVLLTCGVLTIAFGSLKYALGEDSPLADLPRWLPIGLFVTGALLLGLAVVNMLSVRQQLADVRR